MKLQDLRSLSPAVVAFGFLLVPPGPALSGEVRHQMIPADAVIFNPGPTTLPEGVQIAVLLGSPAKEGPFVIRLKFPADYEIPPHRHTQEEHVTVISGGFGMGAGAAHDREAAPLLPPGSFVRIPKGTAHYAWTNEETIVQLNGIGPFGIEYVNNADDPRTN